MGLGAGAFAADVPFPGEESTISTGLESLGNGGDFGRETVAIFGRKDSVIAFPFHAGGGPDPIGDADTCGVLAAHDGGAGRGADLAGRVAVGETHSAFGDSIDVGSFVEGGAFDGEILDAKIVCEDEENVGLFCREDGQGEEEEGDEIPHGVEFGDERMGFPAKA